jgi:hypothetical protein
MPRVAFRGSRGGLSARFIHPIGAPRLPSADRQLTLKRTVGSGQDYGGGVGVDAFHRSCAAPISSSGVRHLTYHAELITLRSSISAYILECVWLVCGGRTGGVRCIFFGHVRINSCWSFWRSPWPSSAYWPPWSHTNNTEQLPRHPPPAFLLAPTSWPLRTPRPTPTQLLPPIPPTHRSGRRPSQHPPFQHLRRPQHHRWPQPP